MRREGARKAAVAGAAYLVMEIELRRSGGLDAGHCAEAGEVS